MKILLSILLLLLPFKGIAQNLTCCNTISEAKSLIEGDWKLKGDSKNVVYRFSFSKDKGFIEVLKEMNLPPKAEKTRGDEIIINDHETFNIILKQDVYYIEIQSLYYEIMDQILVLDEKHFVYGSGDSQHVFIRDDDN